jgi:hypothetical protein
MAGINDVYRTTPVQEIVGAYARLIERFTACGAQVIIQSTIECNGGITGEARLLGIRELNEQLRALVSRNPQVKWLDLNQSMANSGGLRVEYAIADGIHLSAQGYLAWYKALIFADMGRVYAEKEAISFKDMSRDVGFGFRWQTPIAPFRFEWAYPIVNGKLGESEMIFSIGY